MSRQLAVAAAGEVIVGATSAPPEPRLALGTETREGGVAAAAAVRGARGGEGAQPESGEPGRPMGVLGSP